MQPIPNFPGYYVTDDGRIWSAPRKGSGGHGGKLLKPRTDAGGYYHVNLQRDRQQHSRPIHILVLETFVGPRPEGMQCRHLDGDPKNNRPGNLRWGTRSANQLDRQRHGTSNCGEQNGQSRLSAEDARVIRNSKGGGVTQAEMGRIFGVARTVISNIQNGKSWRCAI